MNQKYYTVVGNPEGKVAARIGELAHSDEDLWYVKKYYDTTNVGWELIDIKSFFTQTPTPTQTYTPTYTPTFTPTSTLTPTPTEPITQTPTPTPTLTPTLGGSIGGPCFSGWAPFSSFYFFNPAAKIVGVSSGAVRSGSMGIFGANFPFDGYGFDANVGLEKGNYTSFTVGEDVLFSGMTGIYVKDGTYKITAAKGVSGQNWFTIACSTNVSVPRIFNLSPAVNGKIVWNLDTNGPLLVQGYNTWSISPVLNSFYVNCEVVGGSGGQGGADIFPGGSGGFGSKTIGAFTINEPCQLVGSRVGGNGSSYANGTGGGTGGSGYYSGGRGGNAGNAGGGAFSGGGGGGGGSSAILNSDGNLLFAAGGGGGGGGGGMHSAGKNAVWGVQSFLFSAGTDGASHPSDGGGGGGGGACGGVGGGYVAGDEGGIGGSNGGGFAGTTISSGYTGNGYIIIS